MAQLIDGSQQIKGGSIGAAQLADTAVSPATYGSSTQSAVVTVDADGRITAASNVAISGVAPTGAAGGDLSGTYPNPSVVDDSHAHTSDTLTFNKSFALTGDISPTQLAANTNNWNPTGLSTASTIRVSTDTSRDLTGIAGGADGRVLVLLNVGSFDLVLKDASGSSTAANRFAIGADITLTLNTGIAIQYDSTSSRWRALGGVGGGGGGSPTGSAGGDLGDDYPEPTVLQASTTFALLGGISPSSIGTTQNNYNPSGLSLSSVIRLTSSTFVSITGLQGGAGGRLIILYNIGSTNTIALVNESASSTAANRFALGSDAYIAPGQSVILQYDSTSSRWRGLVYPVVAPSTLVQVDVDGVDAGLDEELNFISGDGVSILGNQAGPGDPVDITIRTIVDKVGLTGQVADITTTPFGAGGDNGQYRVTYYIVVTAGDVTAGAITLTIGYNDGTAARTQSPSALLLTGTAATAGVFVIRVGNATAPTYAVSHTGIFGTAAYSLYLTLEPLGLD